MSQAAKTFKKYGFINTVSRWTEDRHIKHGQGISPTVNMRKTEGVVDYAKSTWTAHIMSDGTKTAKVHYTEKKATDFRALMNKTLNEAVGNGWFSKVNGCALFNNIDRQYGTSLSTHGNYKMADLFDFNGDEYVINYLFNYNLWERVERLKGIGLLNDDMTIDDAFGDVYHSFPTQIVMEGDAHNRDLCLNFIADATYPSDLNNLWGCKAHLIVDDVTTTTINKLGSADTLVCTNDFELEVVGEGPNLAMEPGRPIRLSSNSAQFNPGRRGLIFHVWT